MREILFRGKSKAQGSEWLYGDVLIYENSAQIWETINSRKHNSVVSLETIGQYTGLTDKNGKKIFEGDIGKGFNPLHPDRNIYQVVYEENGFYYCDEDGVTWHHSHIENFEVIGNIHDNLELLKGGE